MDYNNDERYWNISLLNKWFLLASILWTISMIWMFIDDNDDDFKDYQREFYKISKEKAEEKYNSLYTEVIDIKITLEADLENKKHFNDYNMEYLNDGIWKAASGGISSKIICPIKGDVIEMKKAVYRMLDYIHSSLVYFGTEKTTKIAENIFSPEVASPIYLKELFVFKSTAFNGICPLYILPLLPFSVIQSPSLSVVPFTDRVLSCIAMCSSLHPTTQHLPQPLATKAACEIIPPRAVRMASDANIP